jgi:hypothetical protein
MTTMRAITDTEDCRSAGLLDKWLSWAADAVHREECFRSLVEKARKFSIVANGERVRAVVLWSPMAS